MNWSKEIIEKVELGYRRLKEEIPELETEIYARVESEEEETSFLLKYLYSHMPLSDAVDYSYEMFRQFAEYGKKLRKEVVWEKTEETPEEIFLENVLFHRVNTESITFCRKLFAEFLSDRVRAKKMEDAILEANYWCAQEATYQATDERTISAEGVFRGAIGRCGEESVFAVNVMRSLGIPARQVYAHRWAHCDDNHAWVEVWCDGEWHFLGACEPEEMLDRGWFLNASSRAMMIHSRRFGGFVNERGQTLGQSLFIEQNGITVAVNELKRYAKTATLVVFIKNQEGDAVADAEVSFSLLNYSELVPIAFLNTDINGRVSLETGFGSLWISVRRGELFAEAVVDAAKGLEYTLVLETEKMQEVWKPFDMNAPKGIPVHTKKPTKAQKETGKEKLEQAVAKRLQKVGAFPGEGTGRALILSRGNAEEIHRFYDSSVGTSEEKEWILSGLSIKDFRDVKAEILEEHLADAICYAKDYEKEIFVYYILNPRISTETLKPYREIIRNTCSKEEVKGFRDNTEKIWDWIQKEIREVQDREYDEIFTTPAGCMKYRTGTFESKKILFVAIARTFGIPARLDPVTGKMQYFKEGAFHTIQTEGEKWQTGRICINGEDYNQWIYMQNWTIAKKENGVWKTLQIQEGYRGGIEMEAEEGEYRVITSNRLPNGNQLASTMEFCMKAGEERRIGLIQRYAKLDEMLNRISLETFHVKDASGDIISSKQFLEKGMQLFVWAEVGKEPTEHIFNEMCERQEEFAAYEKTINVILRAASDIENPTFEKTKKVFPNICVFYDDAYENVNTLSRAMFGDPDKLPLIIVMDENHNGLYSISGYNVGTGDMLLRILKHFK